jgi:HSP20 family protein
MSTALSTRVSQALRPLFNRDPFGSLQQEMDDLLSRFKMDWGGDGNLTEINPSLDFSETDDAYQIRMNVPGVKAEEVNIEVIGDAIRISGEHKEEKEEKGRTYHRVERRSGSFSRSLTLPAAIKQDKVAAECKDGILTVTLPKVEAVKAQKIKVIAK